MHTVSLTSYKLIIFIVILLITPKMYSQVGGKAAATVLGKDQSKIEVQHVSDLNFGTFAPGESEGKITIDITGNYVIPPSGGIMIISSGSIEPHYAAEFKITATAANSSFSMDASTTGLTGPSGTLALELIYDDLTIFTLNNNETKNLKIGGTLTVPSGTTEGSYKGVIDVIFNKE